MPYGDQDKECVKGENPSGVRLFDGRQEEPSPVFGKDRFPLYRNWLNTFREKVTDGIPGQE